MESLEINHPVDQVIHHDLQFLTPHQVEMIDEALAALGNYGELRLIVEKGRLRFLVTQKSYDALKWHPGSLSEDSP